MSKKLPSKRKPPTEPKTSIQYDLFSRFVTNDQSEVSNTVEIWESIPKYFFTPQQVKKLRTPTGHADPFKWSYTSHNGQPCAIKMQPALVEQKDGGYLAFFPSVTEELVEEALKKILTDQQYGIHDPEKLETWVFFTLGMIQKELKDRGRSRSIAEIKHAIEVMSKCLLDVYVDGETVWTGAILQDLVTVGRKEYQADAKARHAARLPLFISRSINHLEYKQYNYDRHMTCDGQLSRWINKRLIHRYRNANYMNDHHFMYSSLKESGLLQQAKEGNNRTKVIDALSELKMKNTISAYVVDERKQGNKIIDIKYTVTPTSEFIGEQKAANKRVTDNSWAVPVDKLEIK